MNERQHFEILLIEVMEMETVSVQQLQQQFCMGFNQAVRFMEYLSTHQMLEETLTLTVSRQFKSFTSQFQLYWSSRAGHFYLRIFILQWTHSIVGCMRPFKIVIMNELRDFLFNNVFIHGRSVT